MSEDLLSCLSERCFSISSPISCPIVQAFLLMLHIEVLEVVIVPLEVEQIRDANCSSLGLGAIENGKIWCTGCPPASIVRVLCTVFRLANPFSFEINGKGFFFL